MKKTMIVAGAIALSVAAAQAQPVIGPGQVKIDSNAGVQVNGTSYNNAYNNNASNSGGTTYDAASRSVGQGSGFGGGLGGSAVQGWGTATGGGSGFGVGTGGGNTTNAYAAGVQGNNGPSQLVVVPSTTGSNAQGTGGGQGGGVATAGPGSSAIAGGIGGGYGQGQGSSSNQNSTNYSNIANNNGTTQGITIVGQTEHDTLINSPALNQP
jgi:hypothetical protein